MNINDSDEGTEQNYRRLVENLSGGYFFFVQDVDGRFTYVSPSVTKTLGYSQEEFRSYFPSFLTDHPINHDAKESTKRSLQGIQQPAHEIEIFHKDGNFHWLEINEIPLVNEEGNVIALEGIAHDISRRKGMEDRLKRFRSLLDETSDAIFIAAPETGRYLDVNERACLSLGYSREELLLMNVVDVEVVFQSLGDWHSHITHLKGRGSLVAEGMHRRKDGSEFHIEANVKYVSHRESDYVVAIIRDISERKEMEIALQESQDRYLSLFEESKDALYIVNAQGMFEDVNKAMLNLFGYERDEMIGMKVKYVYANPRERGQFIHALSARGFLQDYELTLKKKNGSVIPCLISTILRKRNGEVIEFQGIIRDLTERRKIRDRIYTQERLASLGQLSSGIAHDFNNILMGITGYSQLMLRDKELSEKFRHHIEVILKQGQRASGLIKQMLDFGRKTVIQRKSMDFGDFLHEEIKLLRSVIPENISLLLSIPPDAGYVIKADATQMHQVLLNLGVNAADEMPEGGDINVCVTPLEITVGNQEEFSQLSEGSWIWLSVSNTGSIIPPELLPHVFEPFFTTKEVGKGTGLGLSQVYGIVRQHEGFIEVESSQESGGTQFNIFLPESKEKPVAVAMEEDTTMPKGKGETVLLVEDEPVVLEAVKHLLKFINYKVIVATNGQNALEVYRGNQESIDVVVTDVVMPIMGGVELYRELRRESPELKVIMMSGYPLGDDNRRLLSEGVVDWIQKPLSLERLSQALRKAIIHS